MTIKPRAERSAEFVGAIRIGWLKELGFDIFSVYCHAYLETGNFQCVLADKAYNPWGVKGHYKGNFYEVPTIEEVDGKDIKIRDKFRVYPNFDVALHDYVDKINTIYPEAYKNRGNYKLYYAGLVKVVTGNDGVLRCVYPSWSTRPVYPLMLTNTYDRLKKQGDLYQLICGQ